MRSRPDPLVPHQTGARAPPRTPRRCREADGGAVSDAGATLLRDRLLLRPEPEAGECISRVFQNELRFLGITSSPSYVGSPEGNGVAERMVRTLKEQLLWVRTFDTVEELRAALQAFRDTYNDNWLLGRWRHRTPAVVRAELTTLQAAA